MNDDDNKDKVDKERAPFDATQGDTLESGAAEALEKKCEEYLNGWKRAQADYQNLVKEFEGRRNDYVRFANVNLIIELLPILDNFKLAFSQVPETEKNSPWVIGFQHIKKQLEDFLAREGVENIKTVGEPFNHELHEIVDEGVGENEPPEATRDDIVNEGQSIKQVVVKEIRPGYLLNTKVVQVAKVVVSQNSKL
jgi:molecular chaperone GrpE